LIEAYLNQTAVWYKRTGVNKFNEPTFADAVTIPCRIERKIKLFSKTDSEMIKSDTTVWTKVAVLVGDKIGDRVVQWVEDMQGLTGVEGYKAYL